MEHQILENYNPFFSIPQKKIDNAINDIKRVYSNTNTGVLSSEGSVLLDAIYKYAATNIPIDYWFREMDNFTGDKSLLKVYNKITENISEAYKEGASFCFAGNHGLGKTMVSACILKRVVETGKYNGLYVNLVDIVSVTLTPEKKQEASKCLLSVDFLVIDEFDSRFMGTENASDLFGRLLEPILRSRIQNKLPIFLCTNSPDPSGSFNGSLQQSFKSLMKKISLIPVLGKDHR